MNHYEVLGVDADAPVGEIRRAYLRAVLGDAADGDDDRRRAAASAWAVLRDADQRAAYDADVKAAHGEGRRPPADAPDVPSAAADVPVRRPHPPMPDDMPSVAPEREPTLLAPDAPGGSPTGRGDRREGVAAKLMGLFPPLVIGLGIVLALGAFAVGSAGVLLLGLALMAVGVTSFILIPLFDNIVER